MKSESSIRKQIARLKNAAQNNTGAPALAAYEAWHALRWVIENVDWTPVKNINGYLPDNKKV